MDPTAAVHHAPWLNNTHVPTHPAIKACVIHTMVKFVSLALFNIESITHTCCPAHLREVITRFNSEFDYLMPKVSAPLHTHTYTYIHTYTQTHTLTHTYTQTHTQNTLTHTPFAQGQCAVAHTHTYTQTHTQTHSHTHTHTQTHSHTHTFCPRSVRRCTHTHTHTHTHTQTHTQTHSHTHLLPKVSVPLHMQESAACCHWD